MIISGPELPFAIKDGSMITSPTGRSVILIGGQCSYSNDDDWEEENTNPMIELAEDSTGILKWTVIEPKLQHPRWHSQTYSNVLLP